MSDAYLDDFQDNSKTALEEIMSYVEALETIDRDIEALEESLKEKKKSRDELAQETLPAMLAENGLDYLGLSNNRKLTIKEDVFVSVPKNDAGRKTVLDWLSNNGGSDLIKEDLVIEGPTEDLKTYCAMRGIVYEQDKAVNTNSLKAWFKRKLGMTKGSIQEIQLNDVPKEANLYVAREAVIK